MLNNVNECWLKDLFLPASLSDFSLNPTPPSFLCSTTSALQTRQAQARLGVLTLDCSFCWECSSLQSWCGYLLSWLLFQFKCYHFSEAFPEIDGSSHLGHITLFYCLHCTYYITYVFIGLLSVSSYYNIRSMKIETLSVLSCLQEYPEYKRYSIHIS